MERDAINLWHGARDLGILHDAQWKVRTHQLCHPIQVNCGTSFRWTAFGKDSSQCLKGVIYALRNRCMIAEAEIFHTVNHTPQTHFHTWDAFRTCCPWCSSSRWHKAVNCKDWWSRGHEEGWCTRIIQVLPLWTHLADDRIPNAAKQEPPCSCAWRRWSEVDVELDEMSIPTKHNQTRKLQLSFHEQLKDSLAKPTHADHHWNALCPTNQTQIWSNHWNKQLCLTSDFSKEFVQKHLHAVRSCVSCRVSFCDKDRKSKQVQACLNAAKTNDPCMHACCMKCFKAKFFDNDVMMNGRSRRKRPTQEVHVSRIEPVWLAWWHATVNMLMTITHHVWLMLK